MMRFYDKGEDWSTLKKIEYENKFLKMMLNPMEKIKNKRQALKEVKAEMDKNEEIKELKEMGELGKKTLKSVQDKHFLYVDFAE
jgi:hypothetical protein